MPDLSVRDHPPVILGDDLAPGTVITATEDAIAQVQMFGSERVRVLAKADEEFDITITPYRSDVDQDGKITLTLVELADLITTETIAADTEGQCVAESIGDFAFVEVKITAGASDVTLEYVHVSQQTP